MSKNHRAFSVGVGIIAALSAASMALLFFDVAADAGLGIWASLLIAGFVAAAMAESWKLLTAVLLVLPGAILFMLENWLWQLTGEPADHFGVQGSIVVLLMSLPFGALLCAVGGLFGWLMTRGSTHNKPLQATCEDVRA